MTTSNFRIPLAQWKLDGKTFDYRGHSIFVRVAGDPSAEVLLLIHGFPTASWDWEALWPTLTRYFRVYTLDMIGFGFSAKPKQYEYSMMDQADLFEAFLAARDVPAFHVLAHDYGDTVAQELLARQLVPGRRPKLLSMAFLNGGLFPETHRPVFIQRLLLSPFGAWVSKLITPAKLAQNMGKIFGPDTKPSTSLLDGFWTLVDHNDGLAVMHKLIHYMTERKRYRARWVGALQNTQIPLKLINGAFDPISGLHMAEHYRALVPGADVSLLPNIGHYPQIEAPDEVLTHYLEFAKTHRLG